MNQILWTFNRTSKVYVEKLPFLQKIVSFLKVNIKTQSMFSKSPQQKKMPNASKLVRVCLIFQNYNDQLSASGANSIEVSKHKQTPEKGGLFCLRLSTQRHWRTQTSNKSPDTGYNTERSYKLLSSSIKLKHIFIWPAHTHGTNV